MTPERVREALDGLATFFEHRETRAGVVARRMLGTTRPQDDRLTDQLIRERRSRTRLDGSLDGSLHGTTHGAWELLQLGCRRGHAGLDRMLGYLLSRQDEPGRFGEGCSPNRHAIAHCNHHLQGFFSPGSRDRAIAPLVLASGAVIPTEFGARFAVSCFALRVVLQAGEERRTAVRDHLDGLFTLAARWRTDPATFPRSVDVAFSALGAMGFAPVEYKAKTLEVLDYLVAFQADDGQWPDASVFHVLDGVLHVTAPASQQAVERALPTIIALQTASGGFDPTDDEEIALTALRAIRSLGHRRLGRRSRASLSNGGR